MFNKEREIALMKKEAKAEVDMYVADLMKQCRSQIAEAEHEFHSAKEFKGIELAKLDALIEAKKLSLEMQQRTHEKALMDKNEVITQLTLVIQSLSKPHSKTVQIG